jgi:hypothetical protein
MKRSILIKYGLTASTALVGAGGTLAAWRIACLRRKPPAKSIETPISLKK